MKRHIGITLILLAAAVTITVLYFKNLNPPGRRTSQIINSIPNTAAFLFEFDNNGSFNDLYDNSTLISSVTNPEKLKELRILHRQLLSNRTLRPFFDAQHIYLSVHPQQQDSLDFLITLSPSKNIAEEINQLKSQPIPGAHVKNVMIGGKPGFTITIDSLQRDFFIINKGNNFYAGSFSKQLVQESAVYKPKSKKPVYALLPDQQASNSLANLYINYQQLQPLLQSFYKDKNPDLLKALQMLPATATLSLNYKRDALMFNGFTAIDNSKAVSYISLFKTLKPANNELKDIFPATTAYSWTYATANVPQFEKLLTGWQQKANVTSEKTALFKKIKAETGVNFEQEFNSLLSNEFAVITTRFQEKLAIIKIKNGSKLLSYINNISTLSADELMGQLNYDRLPLWLLGDAFSSFKRPYFKIIDNYLVLANTPSEINNFYNNYTNRNFLSIGNDYKAFNDILARQCNITFFIQFKNAAYLFKQQLKPAFYKVYQQKYGLSNYYAAAYQLTASDNEFYTNFCMKINEQSTSSPN